MISLVLALGNKGKKYVGTRHNLGFELGDRVAVELKAGEKEDFGEYWLSKAQKGDLEVWIAWPKTYMNGSGEAAVKLLEQLQISLEEMLVLVDDFALPLGALRFRSEGSDGGHNGLASIIETIGTERFPRLRMGIGPVDKSIDIVDFVLSKFTASERKQADEMLVRATEAVHFAIDHRLEEAMSKYNSNPAPSNNT
ncbi:MAG: aminoacyl-tRNA hydrolase [Candidatus Zixiibacteriota bacterium]